MSSTHLPGCCRFRPGIVHAVDVDSIIVEFVGEEAYHAYPIQCVELDQTGFTSDSHGNLIINGVTLAVGYCHGQMVAIKWENINDCCNAKVWASFDIHPLGKPNYPVVDMWDDEMYHLDPFLVDKTTIVATLVKSSLVITTRDAQFTVSTNNLISINQVPAFYITRAGIRFYASIAARMMTHMHCIISHFDTNFDVPVDRVVNGNLSALIGNHRFCLPGTNALHINADGVLTADDNDRQVIVRHVNGRFHLYYADTNESVY